MAHLIAGIICVFLGLYRIHTYTCKFVKRPNGRNPRF